MQEHDARVLRGAAIPTAVAGAIAMIVAFAINGIPALVASASGTLLVLAFFAVSFVAVCWAGRHSVQLMFPAAMGSYLIKIVLLGALLVVLRDIDGFDSMAFGLTAIAGAVVWVGAHMRAMATDRRPIVEPVDSTQPDAGADVGERP